MTGSQSLPTAGASHPSAGHNPRTDAAGLALASTTGTAAHVSATQLHRVDVLEEAHTRIEIRHALVGPERRRLLREGESVLKGSKYQWLRNPANMSREQKHAFAALRDSHLKTARAWAMKAMAIAIWRYPRRGWADKSWREWLGWAQRCRLAPMQKVAATLKQHLWGILNAIVLGVHNGHAESPHSRIQRLKARACGFRNRERFRTSIYFHCGGLDLMP